MTCRCDVPSEAAFLRHIVATVDGQRFTFTDWLCDGHLGSETEVRINFQRAGAQVLQYKIIELAGRQS